VASLEEPDEGRPVHMRARKRRLYHSDAKEEKCDSETISSVEHSSLQKLHVHDIIFTQV